MFKRSKLKALIAVSFAAASVGMCDAQSNTERCYLATGGVKVCGDQAFPEACQINADSTGISFTVGPSINFTSLQNLKRWFCTMVTGNLPVKFRLIRAHGSVIRQLNRQSL